MLEELDAYRFVLRRFGESRFVWEYDPEMNYGPNYWNHRIPLFDEALAAAERHARDRSAESQTPAE
jgi:hypothetical protein